MTDKERAYIRITTEGEATIDTMVSDIAELLQLDNAHITAVRRSASSIFLLSYDSGELRLCDISDSIPNKETTDRVIEHLVILRNNYARVFLNPARIMHALIERQNADNARAASLKKKELSPYTVKRIGIMAKGYSTSAYLVIEVEGREQFITDDNLSSEIFNADYGKLADTGELSFVPNVGFKYIYNGYGQRFPTSPLEEGVTVITRDSYERQRHATRYASIAR